MSINLTAVLRHASVLQRATTLRELVNLTYAAVTSETRYRTAWLALVEPEDPGHFRVAQVEGTAQEIVLEHCPRVAIAGDAMLAELIEGRTPVLVLDAPLDPRTNKAVVATLGNRTILNVPLVLGPVVIGALGVGTFGAEGILPPTDDELEALVILATQLAGAITRMQLIDKQRQETESRQRLERHLASLQRVELMGVLAAGVAHDLNNCLAVVKGNLELMDLTRMGDGSDAADAIDAREAALHASDRATGIVRQLLSLGRGGAGQRESVDLEARVASTVQLMRSGLPSGVVLTHEPGGSPAVHGDPVQIEQAIANLLINARDAVGEDGRITIAVSNAELSEEFAASHRWARPGHFGRVEVSDSGEGIDPSILPRIFEPLFSTKASGTGLGLAVVSRVAEQHDALIQCESSRERGTTFALYFPVG